MFNDEKVQQNTHWLVLEVTAFLIFELTKVMINYLIWNRKPYPYLKEFMNFQKVLTLMRLMARTVDFQFQKVSLLCFLLGFLFFEGGLYAETLFALIVSCLIWHIGSDLNCQGCQVLAFRRDRIGLRSLNTHRHESVFFS